MPKDEDSVGDVPVFGSNGPYTSTSSRNTDIPAIVLGRKGSYGKVNWAPDGCFASDTTFFVDARLTNTNLRWLYWSLQTLGLDEGSQEAAVPGLNRESVYEERLCLPSPKDQTIIANYLDRETARIDELIAERERMLALLEEKRAALTSRVVTRGLDPGAPLKPSGQEWLGEIPAHWGILQLRFACDSLQIGPFGTQLHAEEYVDNGVPVINPAHLKGNRITPDFGISVDEETAERLSIHRLAEGDIVFGRRGELGRCGIVEESQVGWICGTGSLRVRCDRLVLEPSYLALVFNSTAAAVRLTLESVGSTMDNLNTEMLGHFRIPLPPLDEQREIVRAVEADQRKAIALRASLQLSITLAKERRAALISAAVTGQIPVEEMRG
ncbi:MAG: restriction endonuclease subunit S [Lysobacterales bacterium]